MRCIHYMLICVITQSVFVISWVSQGLDSVTVSQPWLIALAWPWLYQISHKLHPIIINIVKVLQCHQISTFWCVINSSGCIIDKWKHKSMAEKIFHNPAEHGCHFYEKFHSLSYTVKHTEPYLEYFMESAGIQYLRTSCWRIRNHTSEGSEQVRFLIQKQVHTYLTKHFPCGVVLLCTYWDIHHFGRTHLGVNIYDIAFWWIFLSVYIIKFLTARLLSMVVVWNHRKCLCRTYANHVMILCFSCCLCCHYGIILLTCIQCWMAVMTIKKSDVRILHLQILRQQNKSQVLEFQALNNQKTVALVLQEKKCKLGGNRVVSKIELYHSLQVLYTWLRMEKFLFYCYCSFV